MAYKGNDLDLRLLRPSVHAWEAPDRTRGPPLRERSCGAAGEHGANPIAVDDNVLACCNAAFDVARFHASQDVRLEHLLHALTRVGVAVELLTDLGIRVDMLRRETAVAIAAEMPAGPVEDDRMPHASTAFEDVLRRAADQAAKRHVPAGLHDLLRTMLGGGAGSPSAALLMRAAADPQRLERWRDAPLRDGWSVPRYRRRSQGPRRPKMSPGAAEALLGTSRSHGGGARGHCSAEAAADRQHRRAICCARCNPGSRRCPAKAHARRRPRDRSHAVDAMLETKLGDLGKSVGALGRAPCRPRQAGGQRASSLAGNDMAGAAHAHGDRRGPHRRRRPLDVANRIADAFAERLGQDRGRPAAPAGGDGAALGLQRRAADRARSLRAGPSAGGRGGGKTHARDSARSTRRW